MSGLPDDDFFETRDGIRQRRVIEQRQRGVMGLPAAEDQTQRLVKAGFIARSDGLWYWTPKGAVWLHGLVEKAALELPS